MTFVLILIFLFVFVVDFIPLIKYKEYVGASVFGFFFLLGLTFMILQAIDIKVPSILTLIDSFFELIGIHY